jgi:uncharacterized membrane protein YukC
MKRREGRSSAPSFIKKRRYNVLLTAGSGLLFYLVPAFNAASYLLVLMKNRTEDNTWNA